MAYWLRTRRERPLRKIPEGLCALVGRLWLGLGLCLPCAGHLARRADVRAEYSLDSVQAGAIEVQVDDPSRFVKAALSGDPAQLYSVPSRN